MDIKDLILIDMDMTLDMGKTSSHSILEKIIALIIN